MKRYEYEIQGRTVTFDCESRKTRNGFAHDAACTVDGRAWYTRSATRHYLNRTWERYPFQSVCGDIVRKELEDNLRDDLARFRDERGYARMTERRRAEFAAWIDGNANGETRFWCEVCDAVSNLEVPDDPPEWCGVRRVHRKPSDFLYLIER